MRTIDLVIGTYQNFVLSPGRRTTITSATGNANVISVEGRRTAHFGLGLGLLNLDKGYETLRAECD